MSDAPQATDTGAEPLTDRPPTGGLPSSFGSKNEVEQERREGQDLLDAASTGEPLRRDENEDLVDYFLTNDGLPGDDELVSVDVKVGRGKSAKKAVWLLHSIEWDEWQDGRERGTDEKTGKFDPYVAASWHVARGLADPKLGPPLMAARERDGKKAPADAAELLRRMFAKQSGTLLELSAKVLEASHLSDDEGSVTETDIEAAKN